MNTETIQIKDLLPWGEGRAVETKNGPRILRTALPDEKFWAAWRTNKDALKAAGISCSQRDGQWLACWWQVQQQEQEQRAAIMEQSRATDADVELVAPGGFQYKGYQKAGVAFSLKAFAAGRGVLIGDEMGLGKTIQAIGIINCRPDINKVLIICPATLKINWHRELTRWLVRPLRVGIQDSTKKWIGASYDVVITNYDILHKFHTQLAETSWDLRVIDEAHYVKSRGARRTKHLFGYEPSKAEVTKKVNAKLQEPEVRAHLFNNCTPAQVKKYTEELAEYYRQELRVEPIRARFKCSMTGTPIENRPMELFTILNDLDPKMWPSGFSFGLKYANGHQTRFGWDFSGSSNEAQLQTLLRCTCMVRRLKKDVLTELPPKQRQLIELSNAGFEDLIQEESEMWKLKEETIVYLRARVELAKASEKAQDYADAVTKLKEANKVAFEEMAAIRHRTALAKLPQCLAYVEEIAENGKMIIFAHHLDVMDRIKAQFPAAAMVRGGMSTEAKMREVDRFQNDPACPVFIGNNAAAEGLTLVASSHVVFFELDWNPAKQAQKEDRAHRIGQRDSVLVSILVMEGSLDARMAQFNVRKLDIADKALDRDTGATLAAKAVDEVEIELPDPDPIIDDPATPTEITWEQVQMQAVRIPVQAVQLALRGMQMLAGVCDGASTWDGAGFSKVDAAIGHSLARQGGLSAKQAVIAIRLCTKYRNQLGGLNDEIKAVYNPAKAQ